MSKYMSMLATLSLLASAAGAATYTVDASRSRLEVATAKAGLFRAAGHTHLIRAMQYTGEVEADPAKPGTARLKLLIPAAKLKVLDPELSEKDRATIQQNMEGEHTLEVARFVTIKFDSQAVTVKPTGGQNDVVIEGTLDLHGVQKKLRVPCVVKIAGNELTATGEVELRQKDFDITPFSAGLGAVKVKNEVRVTFEIVAVRKAK